jgi:hypothetical protein
MTDDAARKALMDPLAEHEFVNELGNRIYVSLRSAKNDEVTINIEKIHAKYSSSSNNTVTKMEAVEISNIILKGLARSQPAMPREEVARIIRDQLIAHGHAVGIDRVGISLGSQLKRFTSACADAILSLPAATAHPSDEAISASADAAAGRMGVDESIAVIGQAMAAAPADGVREALRLARTVVLDLATSSRDPEYRETLAKIDAALGVRRVHNAVDGETYLEPGWLAHDVERASKQVAGRPELNERTVEVCAITAETASLPDDYIWGHDAMEQFNFGKRRAAEAIRALKTSAGEPQ